MLFAGTTLSVINLVLCIIIFVMGLSGYRKDKNKLRLYIAFAFALFGISHFVTILDIETIAVLNFLIIIRTIAYLSVVFALYKASSK
jgi:hypothetical protein